MNKRQKKKAFKKRFGFNPPRSISIKTAMRFMKRETIIATFERLKAVILDVWERVKQTVIEFIEELKEVYKRHKLDMVIENFQTKLPLQQESEVKRIEGNSDIHNHNRRQGSRRNKAF